MRAILILIAAALGVAACTSPKVGTGEARAQVSVTPSLELLDVPAIHRLIRLSENLYSGAAPSGAETFEALAGLGVRTLVCVDSARPDVEGAAAYGLRYVHVPIGYDSIDADSQAQIAALVEEGDGPFYFHCHHGKHRGPAAAAVALRFDSGCTAETAHSVLSLAETSPDYPGLWRDVGSCSAPAEGQPRPELRPVAVIGSFEGAMARIDRTWDHLKLIRAAGWRTPDDHPDLVPSAEAALLVQDLRACQSGPPEEFRTDADLHQRLKGAVELAESLHTGLAEPVAAGELESRFEATRSSCKDCHRDYRNT